jgi:hypothetical protein
MQFPASRFEPMSLFGTDFAARIQRKEIDLMSSSVEIAY